MNKFKAIIAGITMICLLATITVFAQNGMPGKGGKGMNKGQRLYDTKTEETLSGEVLSVDNTAGMNGRGNGIHIILKTDKEKIPVHLGPANFINDQEIKINPKDKITVTGSRVEVQGKTVIIAATIVKDGKTLQLRDSNGVPVWAGSRNRK